MIVDKLKESILQIASEGKLVEQTSKSSTTAELNDILSDLKDDKKYKYYPIIDIPFEIPQNWLWVKLEDICLKITDGTHSTPKYTDSGIPFLSVKDLSSGKISFENTKFISLEEHKQLYGRCNPEYGDILITKVGTTGVPAIVETDEEFSIFVSVALLKINTSKIYNKYLYYILQSPVVQKQVKENTRGVGNKNWVLDAIKNTKLPLPPLEEQYRIIAKIEDLFFKLDTIKNIELELNNLKNNFPSDMKKSILLYAIQGKLSENNEKEIVNSTIINKKINISAPFNIPSNWIWLSHNDLFEVIGGSQPPKSKFSPIMKDGYIQLYQTRDYGPNPQPVFVDKNDVSKFSEKGDIILARYGGSLGKVFWAEDGAYNVALARVIIKYPEVINKKYLYYYYLADLYQSKVKNGNRSAQAGFSKDDLNDLPFPLPPLEEQQRIVDKIEELLPLCDDIEKIVNNQ